MSWALSPIQINGQRVHLRPYTKEDFPRIAKAINDPKGWFGQHWHIDTIEKIEAMLEKLLQGYEKGLHNPVLYQVENEIAGISRLLRIEAANKSLEIGGTWIAPKWRKSFVNTEVKFLLLQHCFESLGSERVEFRVDARNVESQRAVLRIGARCEGRLRNRQVYPDGMARDGLLYSVIRPDWPKTKENLLSRIENPSFLLNPKEIFPKKIETSRLYLRPYHFDDAGSLFHLFANHRLDLSENFPTTFKEIQSRDDIDKYILDKVGQWQEKKFFGYLIFTKDTNQLLGQFHIKNINWEISSVELSYLIDSKYRKQGYATEVLEKMIHLCQQEKQMQRIFIRVLPSNQASLHLAKKLNFEREGLHRKEYLTADGKLSDLFYFSLS